MFPALRALLVLVVALTLSPAAVATAEDDGIPRTYLGNSFGAEQTILPTSYEHQSKLWFQDDAWWALMYQPADGSSGIFELLPDHTWRPTGTVISTNPADMGDALLDGNNLYVVTRAVPGTLEFRLLTYDERAREYTPQSSQPVPITARGSRAPAAIAKDTTGRLWVAFAGSPTVLISHSDDSGSTWTEPAPPAVPTGATASFGEVAAVVAFGERIGVMWSDQAGDAFRFAVHRDGAPNNRWTEETPLAGAGQADNHISLKSAGSGQTATVIAAVKTSLGDRGEPASSPLIMVLRREQDGAWTTAVGSTVNDGMDSPHIQVDESTDSVYLMADAMGGIYGKRSSLRELSFGPGRGLPFAVVRDSRLKDVTGSKLPVNATTGLVVLASGTADNRYSHAEMPLASPDNLPSTPAADDVVAPTTPGELTAQTSPSGTVSITWAAANDGDVWAPASDGVPVAGYTVYRDGLELGATASTSYGDVPPVPGASFEYSVEAVDRAGNRSAPATVLVAVPDRQSADQRLRLWFLLALAGLVAVAVAVAVTGQRRRR